MSDWKAGTSKQDKESEPRDDSRESIPDLNAIENSAKALLAQKARQSLKKDQEHSRHIRAKKAGNHSSTTTHREPKHRNKNKPASEAVDEADDDISIKAAPND